MILLTGGSGQLGSAFRRLLPESTSPSHAELDLAHPRQVSDYLVRTRPDQIINCAAYTAVDRAEDEEDLATVVNGEAVGVLAGYAADAGIPFVTFSTDYVFDGTASSPYVESDDTNPINAYGRSKLAGERAALAAHPGALVIRTSWVVSGTHRNFVATVLRLLAERGSMDVVTDQTGSPTFVEDLAPAVLRAMDAEVSGLLHLVNTGETSWYGFARSIAAAAGHDPESIRPISTDEFGAPAPRPAYSVMESERLEALALPPLPAWEESLPAVVAEQAKAS